MYSNRLSWEQSSPSIVSADRLEFVKLVKLNVFTSTSVEVFVNVQWPSNGGLFFREFWGFLKRRYFRRAIMNAYISDNQFLIINILSKRNRKISRLRWIRHYNWTLSRLRWIRHYDWTFFDRRKFSLKSLLNECFNVNEFLDGYTNKKDRFELLVQCRLTCHVMMSWWICWTSTWRFIKRCHFMNLRINLPVSKFSVSPSRSISPYTLR